MRADLEVAWAAGLFEGEGCIYVGATTRALVLRTTDLDVLERFRRVVGCGGIRGPLPVSRPHHKPAHEWRLVARAQREEVLRAFLPYLGDRRRAAAEAMLALSPPVVRARECVGGHPLYGPDADVRVSRRRGRTERACRRCYRERRLARVESSVGPA